MTIDHITAAELDEADVVAASDAVAHLVSTARDVARHHAIGGQWAGLRPDRDMAGELARVQQEVVSPLEVSCADAGEAITAAFSAARARRDPEAEAYRRDWTVWAEYVGSRLQSLATQLDDPAGDVRERNLATLDELVTELRYRRADLAYEYGAPD